nr:immunoglobulin light chain junction region [Macaca mulatta]MOW28358.1 immunoglobulin light chain junction region [Macaca mulatta]MOW28725.1 immunoglobulin light chain junction region [Macaca mulatta]MOW28986.1 immunoglobulin light chain junction region [Macaca mulatta]MOW29155.1 immunoglobulin light chain junction region [Macaca mulatta]
DYYCYSTDSTYKLGLF